eukprot:6207105-Pleurochrysis_carterae.AAC.5
MLERCATKSGEVRAEVLLNAHAIGLRVGEIVSSRIQLQMPIKRRRSSGLDSRWDMESANVVPK